MINRLLIVWRLWIVRFVCRICASLSSALDALGEQLDERLFFRANRQFIISRNAIKDIDLWFGSRLSVNLTLAVPERIIISKTKTPIFKKWILREEE